MEPITLIIGLISLFTTLAISARNRQDQKQANKEVMDFNADEAEKSRDWQEEQYKKYESVAAQMQQRQQAGLNPFENIASMSVGSGATASTSANSISPMATPDFSIFGQLAKDFATAEGQNIDNVFNKEMYEKRKQQFDEQVRTLNLSNEQQQFWNDMFKDAYYNEDGTFKSEYNPLSNEAKRKKSEADIAENDALISEMRKEIQTNEKLRSNYVNWLRDVCNIDFDTLPAHLKQNVVLHTYDIFTGRQMNDQDATNIAQLKDQIDMWIGEEADKHTHESDNTSSTLRDIEAIWEFLKSNPLTTKFAFSNFVAKEQRSIADSLGFEYSSEDEFNYNIKAMIRSRFAGNSSWVDKRGNVHNFD